MTRKCHKKCFNKDETNTFNLNSKCVSSCYHKYINVISQLRKLALTKGDKAESEFITSAFSTKEDPLMNLLWSRGGSKVLSPPFVCLSLRHMPGVIMYPYKGFSPFRDQLENQ